MHKAIIKRYNLLRAIQSIYSGLLVIYRNQGLFSKKVHMKILLVHWKLDNLRSNIGRIKRQKDA
jgi:hypothetical protein